MYPADVMPFQKLAGKTGQVILPVLGYSGCAWTGFPSSKNFSPCRLCGMLLLSLQERAYSDSAVTSPSPRFSFGLVTANWTREGLQIGVTWQTVLERGSQSSLCWMGSCRSVTLPVGWLRDCWQPRVLFQRELSCTLLCPLLWPSLSSVGRHWDVAADAVHCRNLAGSSSKAAFLCNRQPQMCLFTSTVVFQGFMLWRKRWQRQPALSKITALFSDKPNGHKLETMSAPHFRALPEPALWDRAVLFIWHLGGREECNTGFSSVVIWPDQVDPYLAICSMKYNNAVCSTSMFLDDVWTVQSECD